MGESKNHTPHHIYVYLSSGRHRYICIWILFRKKIHILIRRISSYYLKTIYLYFSNLINFYRLYIILSRRYFTDWFLDIYRCTQFIKIIIVVVQCGADLFNTTRNSFCKSICKMQTEDNELRTNIIMNDKIISNY